MCFGSRRSSRFGRQNPEERDVGQVLGRRGKNHAHLSRVVRQKLHEAGPGSFPIHRGSRGESAEDARKVLHFEARSHRVVLHHVQVDQGPEVPGLGMGSRGSKLKKIFTRIYLICKNRSFRGCQ